MKKQTGSLDILLKKKNLQSVRFTDDDSLVWVESTDGVGNAFFQGVDGAIQPLDIGELIKGGLFYGGGEFCIAKEKAVFCVNRNQLLVLDLLTKEKKMITPAWGKVASPTISPDGRWVLYVCSDREKDFLAVTPIHGLDWPRQMVKGADFYMQPVWHPQGELIAWAEWDHPCMPWQGSRVKIGEVGGMQIRLFSETWIAGSVGQPAHQPLFSPNGRWLSYLVEYGEWEDLVLYDVKKKEKRILVHGDGFMLSTPDWVQGLHSYDWSHDSRNIFYFRYTDAQTTLWKVNVRSGKSQQVSACKGAWLSDLATSSQSDAVVFFSSSSTEPKKIVELKNGKTEVCYESGEKKALAVDPVHIEWKGEDGGSVFGILYLPTSESTKPFTLLVSVHGGPTSQSNFSQTPEAAFFTACGYAYFQVNYRGSTGYGSSYRDALQGTWGELEVKDVYSGIKYLIETGIADPEKIVIKGSSSGGTTVLNCLRRYPNVFRCGICSYGIGDLIKDAETTHKFEKHYYQYLIGNLPEKKDLYLQRSPLFHIDEIQDPLLLFHGDEDPVVQYSQSVALYDSLNERGIPCTLKIFEKEGHGFRRDETIREYYRMILNFLDQYL